MRSARFALGVGVLLFLVTWQSQADETSKEGEQKVETVAVHGSVVDAAGKPVSGASLTFPGWPEGPPCTSDAEGRYELELPLTRAKGATLVASGSNTTLGYVTLPWKTDVEEPLPSQQIELMPSRVIEVNVADQQGHPAGGVKTMVVASYEVIAQGETDSDGALSLRVPDGLALQYVLADAGAKGIDYLAYRRPGQPVSDPYQLSQDHSEALSLKLSPTRALTVRAEDYDGKPVAGATVVPWYLTLPKKGEKANLGSLWRKTTDDEGVATYDNIPAENENKLNIWVRKEGFVARERAFFDPKSPEAEITATLLPLVPVSGRVLLPDGSPAARIEIRVCGQGYTFDSFRGSTVSAEDGTFQIDVDPDQYYLLAAAAEKWASPVAAKIVRLGQSVGGVELKLQRATRVFGRITVSDDGEPYAGAYVQLYSTGGDPYYDLPEDQRLPNPTDSHRAIVPRIVIGGKTDASGGFEFFTGPGDYYVIGQDVSDPPKFAIIDEAEFEVKIRAEPAPKGKLTGRVVMHDNRNQGVAEVKLFGYAEKHDGGYLRATTDKDGRFEDRRLKSAHIVGVFSEDDTLGTIVRIEPDADNVILIMAPTATLRGTLIDEETGEPAADREIGAYVHVGEKGKPFKTAFRQSDTTDEAGEFEIAAIIPGQHYDIDVVQERGSDGSIRSWRTVTEADPTEASVIDLGELVLKRPYRPPTLEERIAKSFAAGDVAERLQQKLADAKLAYQQVLLVVADPDSDPVKQFFAARYDYANSNREFRRALADYMILGVAPERLDLLKDHTIAAPTADGATFAILSPDQGIVVAADFSQLTQDAKLDRTRLREFLTTRRVPLPDARKQYEVALAKAAKEDRRVLVQVSGPGCPPCILLSRYLDSKSELVAKDYVYLKLDSRMPSGEDLIAELRKGREGGIPWMVILASDGQELISGDCDEGNIGYPGSEIGAAHFKKMLRETRQQLTDEEISRLSSGLLE